MSLRKINRRDWMQRMAALAPALCLRAGVPQSPAPIRAGLPQSPAPIRAGVAEISITPSWTTTLWGYDNTIHYTSGVRDEVYGKAFLFDGGKQFLLITLDSGAIGFPLTRRIARRIHQAIKIDEDAIMIQVTHDHSAPALLDIPSTPADTRYQDFLVEKLVLLAQAAFKDLAPAQLSYGRTDSFIALNRRVGNRENKWDKDSGPIDAVMGVLVVASPEGRKRGVLVNYPSHPVCLREDNEKISADFPGVVYRELGRSVGCPVAYMQGCSGDMIPKVFGTEKEMEDYGRKMTSEAQRAMAAVTPLSGSLDFRTRRVLLTFVAPYSLDDMHARYTSFSRGSHYLQLWAERYMRYLEDGGDLRQSRDTLVQAVRLGDLGIAIMPGEILHLTGELIRKEFPGRKLMVGGYSNDTSVGYLPHADEYPRKGYEVEDSWKYYDTLRTTPDMEKLVRETEVKLLHELMG